MTTRLRVRGARAATLIALIATALMVCATPVVAAPAPIRILSVSAENVGPGDKVRVRFRVTNTGDRAETAIVVVGGGLRCTAGCRAEPNLGPGRSQDFETTLVAPAANPGETTGLNISAAVRLGGQNSYDHTMVYVHGPGASAPDAEKPPTEVDRISGRVRDRDGKAISGAALTVRDQDGHEYRTTTNRSGRFSIRSSADRPITAGRITVVVAMDGYRTSRAIVTGRAGDTANALVTLTAVSAPTKAAPSPDAAASAPAPAATPEPEASVAAPAPLTLRTAGDEGGGSLLSTILGGLLVAMGLGALVLLLIRRRNAPKDAPAGAIDAPTAMLPTVSPDPYGGPARRT